MATQHLRFLSAGLAVILLVLPSVIPARPAYSVSLSIGGFILFRRFHLKTPIPNGTGILSLEIQPA